MWIVKALQRKAPNGEPSGLWRLCCESDEGGGFVEGCQHDHHSAEEAESCRDAKVRVGLATGFPYKPSVITINGREHEVDARLISFETVCELAGQPESASVVYSGRRNGDSQRSGILAKGEATKVEDGLRFDCIVTGNA